jgi:hypothetical protein
MRQPARDHGAIAAAFDPECHEHAVKH